jgi:UrcA family protein
MFNPQKKQPGPTGKRATLMIVAVCMTALNIGSVSAIFAGPAHASTQETVRSKIVRYGDLNLASEHGRTALDQRIRRAAKQVCSVTGTPTIPYSKKRKCVQAAHSKAWAVAQQRISTYRLAVRSAE